MIELLLNRTSRKPESTIGEFFVNGSFICKSLEDTDRHIASYMPLEEINKIKINNITAIPTGVYEVIINLSNRFSQLAGHDVFLPLLVGVPGYAGVRIHGGNKPEDTEGCLLTGTDIINVSPVKDNVSASRVALGHLLSAIATLKAPATFADWQASNKGEWLLKDKCMLTIK